MGPWAFGRIWALALLLTASTQVAHGHGLVEKNCGPQSPSNAQYHPSNVNYGSYTPQYQPEENIPRTDSYQSPTSSGGKATYNYHPPSEHSSSYKKFSDALSQAKTFYSQVESARFTSGGQEKYNYNFHSSSYSVPGSHQAIPAPNPECASTIKETPYPSAPCEETAQETPKCEPDTPNDKPDPKYCTGATQTPQYQTGHYYPLHPTNTDSDAASSKTTDSEEPCEEPAPVKPNYNTYTPSQEPQPTFYPTGHYYPQYQMTDNSASSINKTPYPCVPCEEPKPEIPKYNSYFPNYVPEPRPSFPSEPCEDPAPVTPKYNPYFPNYIPEPMPSHPPAPSEEPETPKYNPFFPNYIPEPRPSYPCVPCEGPAPEKPHYYPFFPHYTPEPKPSYPSAPCEEPEAPKYNSYIPNYTPESKPSFPCVPCEEPAPEAPKYKNYIPNYTPEPKPYYPSAPCEEPETPKYNPYFPNYTPEPKPFYPSAPSEEPASPHYNPYFPNYAPVPKPSYPCVPCEEPASKPSYPCVPCEEPIPKPTYPSEPCDKPVPETPKYNSYIPNYAPVPNPSYPCVPCEEPVPKPSDPSVPCEESAPETPKFNPYFPKQTLEPTTFSNTADSIETLKAFHDFFKNYKAGFPATTDSKTIINDDYQSSGSECEEKITPVYYKQFSLPKPASSSGMTILPSNYPTGNHLPEPTAKIESEVIDDIPTCDEPITEEPIYHPKFPTKIVDAKPCPETFYEEQSDLQSLAEPKPEPISDGCEEPSKLEVDCLPTEPQPCSEDTPAAETCEPAHDPTEECSEEDQDTAEPCESAETPSDDEPCACPEEEITEEENCGGEVEDEIDDHPVESLSPEPCEPCEDEDTYPVVKTRSFIPCAPRPKPILKPILPSLTRPKLLPSWNLPKRTAGRVLKKPKSIICPPLRRCKPCLPCA